MFLLPSEKIALERKHRQNLERHSRARQLNITEQILIVFQMNKSNFLRAEFLILRLRYWRSFCVLEISKVLN